MWRWSPFSRQQGACSSSTLFPWLMGYRKLQTLLLMQQPSISSPYWTGLVPRSCRQTMGGCCGPGSAPTLCLPAAHSPSAFIQKNITFATPPPPRSQFHPGHNHRQFQRCHCLTLGRSRQNYCWLRGCACRTTYW